MKVFFLLSTILFSFTSNAQLNTYSGNVGFVMNPGFLGPNYSVSNVQFTGHPQAVGSFISDSSSLGLSKGVILTTGLIYSDDGPQGPNDDSGAAIDNGYNGTPLIPNSYNASILEFDIWSFVDTIEFRYVFGSDEYPEYVGSQFNDQFRIFIEGPGISGLQNLSYLPSNVYAGINTINVGMNSSLFVYNGDGTNAPYNQDDYYIQYDGFTVPLTAKVAVQTGQTYHITIVVTDVGDAIYDSGVFLEQCEDCNYNASVQSWSTSKISCFPNPSDGEVSIEFPELLSSAELRVINYLGEEIKRVQLVSGVTKLSIDDLPSGSYILEMTTESAVWTGKLTVN
ncbi:MAG: hypothetical protein COA38_09765 [Fluviicola sp.]|nr:MAG: hypothetical protein COA38_09765 [Fluviicola sp.]